MRDLKIAHRVLAEFFADDPEPVPAWGEGTLASLEMCCECSEVQAFGVHKYPDLPAKAAKIFYSAIKLHAFPNANKRFALVLTLLFLLNNGMELAAPRGVGKEVATRIANSDPHGEGTDPDAVIDTLADFYRDNIRPTKGADAAEALNSN